MYFTQFANRQTLHVGKGAKFEVEKVNGGQNIGNRCASVGNEKNFEKEAQHSKG